MEITPTRQTGIPAPKRLTDVQLSTTDLSTTKPESPESTGSSILSSDQTTVIYIGGQSLPPPPLPPVSNDSGRSSDGDSIYEYSLPSMAYSPNLRKFNGHLDFLGCHLYNKLTTTLHFIQNQLIAIHRRMPLLKQIGHQQCRTAKIGWQVSQMATDGRSKW